MSARLTVRALVAAVTGALAGLISLLLLYPQAGEIALEMDRDLPPFVTGVYAIERDGELTFAWTSGRTVVRLAGLDRRVDWTCTARVRGARDASMPQPTLVWSFDGAGGQTTALTNDFQNVSLTLPARPERPGVTLTADIGPTFVPGGSDTRELGAQIDWLRCRAEGTPRPPADALRVAGASTAVVALAVVLAGGGATLVSALTTLVAAGVALLLTFSAGAFGPYPTLLLVLSTGTSALIVLAAWTPRLAGRAGLSAPALAAVAVSATIGCLKLAALVHPAKPLIDAVFQAHRLEWVLAGRYFFTQPLPDGVAFPYAIGLYVTSAPLAALVTDHVLLLRLVTIAAEAIGGVMLYALVARGFSDRAAGVLAVLLFHVVPLPYVVIGNANLTNAFAQAVALMALATLSFLPAPARTLRTAAAWTAFTLLVALAFLSHVSTIVLLAGTLGVTVAVFVVLGRAELRRHAAGIAIATVLAGVLAVGLYYRHFDDVYREFVARVAAPAADGAVAAPATTTGVDAGAPDVLVRPLTWTERAGDAARQTGENVGWPILTLAAIGAATRLRRVRDAGTLLVVSWGVAWLVFLVGGTLTRVDTQYQRYAAEFIGRVNLASYPVAVVLAALGAGGLWRAGGMLRIVATALLMLAAGALGVSSWLGWIR